MDRMEVISIISSDLIQLSPPDEVSRFQQDLYHNHLLLTIRWLCSKEIPDPSCRELWAMVNLAEAAEIALKYFPTITTQRAAQALAFAWERGGDRVEMNTSSRERILAVLEAVS